MKHRISTALLIAVIVFAGGLTRSTYAQTEEEFQQEFQQYAETHDQSEWQAYAYARLIQMTTAAILEEQAWSLLEQSFTSSPCLSVKQQLCDSEFEQRMLEVTALTTAAAAACGLAMTGGPAAFAVCIAAVAAQHGARLSAASRAHRACYLRARLDCLLPPQPCGGINLTNGKNKDRQKNSKPSLVGCSLDECSCQPRSPIIIDLAGNGLNLTNLEYGVLFDMTGRLGPEQVSWTRVGTDDAFLGLDLNANGLIDNGKELFGNFSAQPIPSVGSERNGFAALAVFDLNMDGVIDFNDSVFSELRLWQDVNHNGVSEPDELHSLDQLGLTTLELAHHRSKRVDEYGNEFRYRAKVRDARGAQFGRWAWDVFLVSALGPNPAKETFRWAAK